MSETATRTQTRGGREVVVTAAIANFYQRGYHGTSMRDIARDAGVTVASIYHHFDSKQLLLQEVMTVTLSDVISLTRAAVLDAGGEPHEQLAALVRAWVGFHTSRQDEALIGSSEIRSLDDPGRRLVTTLRDEQERLFRDVIVRGVKRGAFRTQYPLEATRAVIEMGSSVAAWYRKGGHLAPDEVAARYADLALATVRSIEG